MSFPKRWCAFVWLMVALFVSGCASVSMAPLEDDARAKSFSVRADKASIYVYRNESMGGAIPMSVTLNGKMAGQSASKTYFLFEVDPGTHEISSVAENVSTLKINAVAGKAYFVWQEVKMGMWMARSQLQEVDERTGRLGVEQCRRALSNF